MTLLDNVEPVEKVELSQLLSSKQGIELLLLFSSQKIQTVNINLLRKLSVDSDIHLLFLKMVNCMVGATITSNSSLMHKNTLTRQVQCTQYSPLKE